MAATPESKAKLKVKRLIESVAAERGIPYYLRSNAAGGVGFANGTPDFTLYWRVGNTAMPIELEIKAGRGTPTPLQLAILSKCMAAGAHGFVIWGDHVPDLVFLEKFLRRVTPVMNITGKFDKAEQELSW